MNSTATSPIGVLDSGKGGQYAMQQLKTLMPQYDYLFYGDIANMPYGDKTPEQIRSYAFDGLHRLFDHGCELVIIACHTACAYAIRSWQASFPDKKALSVTIPGIEALVESGSKKTLFLSTNMTKESGILPELALKYNYPGELSIISCPGLADLIEKDVIDPISSQQRKDSIRSFVGDQGLEAQSIILACTHYGVRYESFQELYPQAQIIDPCIETAKSTLMYLSKHPEIETKLSKGGSIQEYRTQ